jgi:outer membrane protein OmpA-like peptidoglycan-associated protein
MEKVSWGRGDRSGESASEPKGSISGADQEFAVKIAKSHRWAVALTMGPLAIILLVGALSLRSVTDSAASAERAGADSQRLLVENRILRQNVAELRVVPPPPPPPADACEMPRPPDTASVFFGLNNADLTPTIEAYLKDYARDSGDKGIRDLAVVAYTDSVGTPKRNAELSALRAEAVKKFLLSDARLNLKATAIGRGVACAEAAVREPCHRVAFVVPSGELQALERICGTTNNNRLVR